MAQGEAIAPPQGEASVEAAHAELLKAHDIQFQFPQYVEPTPPDPPAWLKAIADAVGGLFGALGPFAGMMFWAIVALIVLGIIYLIAREAGWLAWNLKGSKTPKGAPAPVPYQPQASVARALLADADALAREGRYAEAVHVLLLRSVEDMHRFRPRAVQPAATSRDIARLDILPPTARGAFVAMADLVETSLFGGRPVDAGGYGACRKAYEDFAFPAVWS